MTNDAHDSLDLGRFPDAFSPLLDKPEALNHTKIWRTLQPRERSDSLEIFIRRPRNRSRLEKAVANARNTRLITVRNKWDDEKVVQIAAKVSLDGLLVRDVMRTLYDVRRAELVASFRNSLGLPREDKAGAHQADELREQELTEAEVHKAATACATEQGLSRSVLFLLLLAADRVPYGEHIWSWMKRVRSRRMEPDQQPSESERADDLGQRDQAATGGAVALAPEHSGKIDEPAADRPPDLAIDVTGFPESVAETPAMPYKPSHPEPLRLPPEDFASPEPQDESEIREDEKASPGTLQAVDSDSRADDDGAETDGVHRNPQGKEAQPDVPSVRDSALSDPPIVSPVTTAQPSVAAEGVTAMVERASLPGPALTDLDELLTHALVGTQRKVLGSLTRDQVANAVDELIHLNGSRHQSCFHSGFRDVLFGRPVVRERPEDNDYRRQWRWAGAICGWEERGEWDRIVEEYKKTPAIRRLGNGKSRATDEAALHVVKALWGKGPEEKTELIADFLAPESLLSPRSARLIEEVVEIGSELLRENRIPEADTMFALVLRVVPELEDSGRRDEVFLTARRRRAHCLQRLDQRDRARALLEELVSLESDPNRLAEDHADLGLIEGGFRELAEVALPQRRRELDGFLHRLREGHHNYRRSVDEQYPTESVPFSAHGHYCLGVLALGEAVVESSEEHYRDAKEHLLFARNQFAARPASYGESLVNRVALYLGVARVGCLEQKDMAQAARLMSDALRKGARLPSYLVDDVLEGLDLAGARKDLSAFASALITQDDDDVLDELSDNEAVLRDCPDVRDSLRDRALRDGASESAAEDFRVCLTGYLKARQRDEALDVLGHLESLAMKGIGTKEFAELLENRRYDGAWRVEEAEIAWARCLEMQGEFENALEVLRPLVRRLAHRNEILEADGFLEHIRQVYQLPEDAYEDLTNWVRAHRLQQEGREGASSGSKESVGVVFVGGEGYQRVEAKVLSELRERDPNLQVTFEYAEWSSKWGRVLERVRSHLRSHHALVQSTEIPTLLGRKIRKACGAKPWRSCTHFGPQRMVISIIAAADAARVS